jgi:hypothetical protein
MHSAFAVLVVAKRLQRQRLQQRLFLGEHRRHLPLGPAMDALVGPALFPVIEICLRLFQALELLALRAGTANSDKGLSGSSARLQP